MFEDKFRELCEEMEKTEELMGTSFESGRKFAVFSMLRRRIKLELVFSRSALGLVNNILFCRVYPNKNDEFYYLLPEVFVELDIPEYRSCFFSMIENEKRLEACFAALWSIIKQHLPAVEQAADVGRLRIDGEAEDDDTLEHKLMFQDGSFVRETAVIVEYTNSRAYRALLNGNTEKAIRLIDKAAAKGKALEYEKRLCAFLKENTDFSPMSDECNALRDDEANGKTALPVYAGAFAFCFICISALLIAASLVFTRFFTSGCTAFFGARWYHNMLIAPIPAFFGTIVLRKKLVKMICPRRAKTVNERDKVKNGRGTDMLAHIAFAASIGFAIGFFLQMHLSNVRIYEDRFDAPREGEVFTREEYRFSDVENVYHISARYNYLDERIGRSSYVVAMKDGRLFDLDGFASERETEEKLLPVLPGMTPISLDSDKELRGFSK